MRILIEHCLVLRSIYIVKSKRGDVEVRAAHNVVRDTHLLIWKHNSVASIHCKQVHLILIDHIEVYCSVNYPARNYTTHILLLLLLLGWHLFLYLRRSYCSLRILSTHAKPLVSSLLSLVRLCLSECCLLTIAKCLLSLKALGWLLNVLLLLLYCLLPKETTLTSVKTGRGSWSCLVSKESWICKLLLDTTHLHS